MNSKFLDLRSRTRPSWFLLCALGAILFQVPKVYIYAIHGALWFGLLSALLLLFGGFLVGTGIALLGAGITTLWPKTSIHPIIRDMRDEYIEALSIGHLRHARWICVRGHLQFWAAAWLHTGVITVRLIKAIFDAVGPPSRSPEH